MAKLNIERTRKALQSFDFKTLFIEELGWSNPASNKTINETIKDIAILRKPISELSGAVVFEITTPNGEVPEPKQRLAIAKEIQKQHFEHVLIFVDKDRKQSIWHWLKNQDKKVVSREHFFFRHQPGDGFIAKIASLVVDISEFDREGNIAIAELASRIKTALDIERVVKKFFRDYQNEYIVFLDLIEGIDNEADRRWYASVILNRLMFIYFLQKKMFLDNGDTGYLNHKLEFTKKEIGKNKFYSEFLSKLFFEGFAKQETQRSAATNKLIGKIKYLNGGLFLQHKIEVKFQGKIHIPDKAFDNLFELFNRYSWTLNDTPGGADNEMNPDVLGYIFEKYINQKAFGAYYTRTEITEYLCEQTVYKLILDEVNEPDISPELLEKAGLSKFGKPKHFESIAEMLLHLDAATCRKLVVGENAVLPNLSLLDPACGSGAFLVAAMKTLINVYAAILGKIEFLGDKKLTEWKQQIEKDHPSINYYIKKQIITNNLYGVDLMEEATEIAKLRLFLALVASAETVDQLEPLPNIDFNILSGNSLIGLMRVDESQYNNHQKGDLFKKSYKELVGIKERAIRNFKNFEKSDINPEILKKEIDKIETEANATLNLMLGQEFTNLGIKYEQVTWDDKKNKEGRSIKRSINIKDIQALEPFHWGYEFSEIFRKKDGFDAIITNPPWEVFKPESKEFFAEYSNVVTKNKMDLKTFDKEKSKILKDKEVLSSWLEYQSRFPHLAEYFRKAMQFQNQTSIINGKKAAANNNLYKLFVEQSFNLLRKGGYCGIVIPASIYTDIGSKQLRELLFDNSKVTGLFCFENRKTIFENVDSRFKFVVLSFEKGGKTKSFPAAFMRHDISELVNFPTYGAVNISVDVVKKLSPDAYSLFEFKSESEANTLKKIFEFPALNTWREYGSLDLSREFNAADDDFRFNGNGKGFRIYEGKMMWHFTSYFADPEKWISETEFKKTHFFEKGDWKSYRIAIRRVSASTNERTLVTTVLPKNTMTSHSLFVNVTDILTGIESVYLTSILNSFVLDFVMRNQATTNITQFLIYQLPIPRLKPKDKWFNAIAERAARLICTTEEFAELWEEVMGNKWTEKKAATTEYERNKLRAELDGIIAHIYGLTEEEFAYILSTFPIVPQPQKVATQNAYRDVERGLIKPN
jgi:hypothetical protein